MVEIHVNPFSKNYNQLYILVLFVMTEFLALNHIYHRKNKSTIWDQELFDFAKFNCSIHPCCTLYSFCALASN